MVYRPRTPSPDCVLIIVGPNALEALVRMLLRGAGQCPPGRFNAARELDELHAPPGRRPGLPEPADELLEALGAFGDLFPLPSEVAELESQAGVPEAGEARILVIRIGDAEPDPAPPEGPAN